MKNTILSVELKNIRNVKYGKATFDRSKDILKGDIKNDISDVLGIYGQNGSGKTTVVDVFELLNDFCIGRGLQNKTDSVSRYEYLVNVDANEGEIIFSFLIWLENNPYKIDYCISLSKSSINHKTKLKGESLYIYKKSDSQRKAFNKCIFDFSINFDDEFILSKFYKKNISFARVVKLNAVKINCQNGDLSYVFSNTFINSFDQAVPSKKIMGKIIETLKKQISDKMFVIRSNRDNLSATGYDKASIVGFDEDDNSQRARIFSISDGPFEILSSTYAYYQNFVKEVNKFISSFVEDFELCVNDEHNTRISNGDEYKYISIVRRLGDNTLPLSAESCGIRKLINLAFSLIFIYGDENGWLIVDEFDSGIFEDLLGNIVSVIEENAKGLLLFTAHNLSPLERIEPKNIVFATTNVMNRYVRFSNIKKSNNLRKLYLRSLVLGGQDEEMAFETSTDEINAALYHCYFLLNNIDKEECDAKDKETIIVN